MAAQRHVIWITVVAITMGTAACTLASPTYISSQEGDQTSEAGASSSPNGGGPGPSNPDAGPVSCGTNDFVKPDLSTLTACGDGKGHCFAKDKISMAGDLVACADASMVCVPDEILLANGQPLKSCTSVIGAGGCVTATLIPQIIKESAGALTQDVCTPTQLCVPCTNPRANGAPTPFCQPIGAHSSACGAGAPAPGTDGGPATALPTCCTTNGKSNGVCLVETAVPADQRDQTKQDSCAPGNKCLPASLVSGKPVTCAALLGAGVCMDKCFNDMMKLGGDIGVLGRTTCGETEVCVPCGLSSTKIPGCP
jgi:hypothetical protein